MTKENKTYQDVRSLINRDLEITIEDQEDANTEELLPHILTRVEELMERDMGLLMSYLYRLDVKESRVKAALDPGGDTTPSVALAQLILERQLARVQTKQELKQSPIKDWDSW